MYDAPKSNPLPDEVPATEAGSLAMALRRCITDAIRYWEPRRLLYNAVLAAVTGVVLYLDSKTSSKELESLSNAWPMLIFFAVLANLCYCAAYPVDIFVQMSDFRKAWHRLRWVLFITGTAFAAMLAAYVAGTFRM